MHKLIAIVAAILSTLIFSACSEQQQNAPPAEGMYRANPQRTGHYITKGVQGSGELAWKFKTGGEVHSSPAVANGMAYFGSDDEHIYALDAYNGQERWKVKTGGMVRSSPAVKDGVVYVGSGDFILYALNGADGREKWQSKTLGYFVELDRKGICCDEYLKTDLQGTGTLNYLEMQYSIISPGIISSPVISGNAVFFGTNYYYVYAVYNDTGKVAWSYRTPSSVSSAPVLDKGNLLLLTDGDSLISMPARSNERENWRAHLGVSSAGSIAVSDEAIFVDGAEFAQHEGEGRTPMRAISTLTGDTLWTFHIPQDTVGYTGAVAIADGLVYFAVGKHLFAVDAKSGGLRWQYNSRAPITVPPSVAEGVVYIGDNEGRLYAVEAVSGREKWAHKACDDITTAPTIADGHVYFGCKDGYLYALK